MRRDATRRLSRTGLAVLLIVYDFCRTSQGIVIDWNSISVPVQCDSTEWDCEDRSSLIKGRPGVETRSASHQVNISTWRDCNFTLRHFSPSSSTVTGRREKERLELDVFPRRRSALIHGEGEAWFFENGEEEIRFRFRRYIRPSCIGELYKFLRGVLCEGCTPDDS